jgi:hypothetical protein
MESINDERFQRSPSALAKGVVTQLTGAALFGTDFLVGERVGSPTMEVIWTVWIKGQTDSKIYYFEKV